jgi:hypothetical protein
MGRKRKPAECNLVVIVYHPEALERLVPEDECDESCLSHPVLWGMGPGNGLDHVLSVEIKRGVSRLTATKLLRQLAEAIESQPESLMATPSGQGGFYDAEKKAFVNDWPDLDMEADPPKVI